MAVSFPQIAVSVQTLSPTAFKRRLDDGENWTLLDTRREEDFEQWKLTHPNLTLCNVPFTEFLDETGEQPAEHVPDGVPDEPLVTCCAKGLSSLYVGQFLAREGWDVLALEEGMEGWATLYEPRQVQSHDAVDVVQYHRPSSGCLAYLLVADGEAAVIDPLRAFAGEYAREARERDATLRYAVDTHVHADHVSGVRAVAESSDTQPILPEGAVDRGLAFDASLVEDGDRLSLGNTDIEAVELPGHTTEMTGFRCGDVLMTGDTLFLDSVARPDLEDEAAARNAAGTLWETLRSIESYPDDTRIAPGHVGPSTTLERDGSFTASLGSLRHGLTAFEESRDAFIERIVAELPPRPNNFERIIAVNLGQESVTSEVAFELELGPNNCAVDG